MAISTRATAETLLPPGQRRIAGFPRFGERLGRPAPARLVSPAQYGYVSTKHVCRVDVHTAESSSADAAIGSLLFRRHPRARVWEEERNGALPTWLVRPLYRVLTKPFLTLGRRSRGSG